MAGRISGITIEIGGDTTKLQTALKGVDGQLRQTQSALKDINKLLKLDPGNTELLTQKQKNLEKAINETKDRLKQLKDAQSQVQEGTAEWDALQREIIATEQQLEQLEREYRNFGSVAAQQIAAAGEKMKDLGNKVSEVGQKFKPVSAAAAALVTAMGGLAYKSVQTADDLNTLSKQTGLSTDSLQKMQYAADLVDVPFDRISGAVTKMKKSMGGTGEAFDKIGVSVKDSSGQMRGAEDVFYDTIKALSRIPNEVERDQLAYEIFGRSADELAGIIDDGGAALREYGDEAQRLGLIMSGETLDALNKTNDAVDKSKAQLKAAAMELGGTIATGLAPFLEKLAGFVEKLVGWMQRLTPEQTNLIIQIGLVVAAIAPLLIIGGKLITGIGMLLTFAPMVVSAFSFLIGPVGLVIAAIAALIAIGVALYKNWDEIKAKAAETWENIKLGWETFKTNISESFRAFGEAARQSFIDTWENIKTATTNAWNGVKDAISSKVDEIKAKISSSFEEAKNKVQSVIDRIRQIINGANWRLPHLAIPHLSVWGTFSLRPPSVPHFSISWYKKAYDNPMMFTSPTVLQTPQGPKGFGDGNGAEIVLGLNKLRELVGGAGDNITINVYASDNMNVNQLADQIQQRLVQLSRQKEAAYA